MNYSFDGTADSGFRTDPAFRAYVKVAHDPNTSYGSHFKPIDQLANMYSRQAEIQGKHTDTYNTLGKLSYFGHSSQMKLSGLAERIVTVDTPIPVKVGKEMPHLDLNNIYLN